MQTFLPYPSFHQSLACLDRQRLGKQRVEAKQILLALQPGYVGGWVNHPAVRMWRWHESALAYYGWLACREWKSRGYRDSLELFFADRLSDAIPIAPPWFGSDKFHRSHQSNLIRKLPGHYGPLFPGVPNDLSYVWPVGRES